MMVANHFDVRWVDGYSAVSDVPSSLAATIEKLAAELPISHDRIELAVRDVRKPDGSTAWVGLLRFVVVVSSAPRPLGFLHAAVLPPGYAIDLECWRALVMRRYGAHPEERIRTLYEELAESTKEIGRDRLHALAIRPEDVCELVEPLDADEPASGSPRLHARPPSKGGYPRPASVPGSVPTPAPSASRISQSLLPLSGRAGSLTEPPPAPPDVEDLPDEQEIPNDVTQPMEAPIGAAAPFSGEHTQHHPVARAPRASWKVGAAAGALVVLLGAVAWMAYRHGALVDELDRLRAEASRPNPDRETWDRDRAELEQAKRELAMRRATDKTCEVRIEAATREYRESLNDARSLARLNGDRVEQLREEARLRSTELQETKTNLTKLKSDLDAATAGKDHAEQLHREEQAQSKQLRATLSQLDEQLRALCRRLQSAAGGDRPPKECQGIK